MKMLFRSKPANKQPGIEDYTLIKVLGKGIMGKVFLASRNNNLYAIKSISKHRSSKEIAHVLEEQRILKLLAEIRHPFLIKLHHSFQTKDNLLLVMEYIPGGDFATQFAIFGKFPVDRVQFYTAEILTGVRELHRLGIVYRDLKPENVLVDKEGHVKLTDFGLAKQLSQTNRTRTFCGTAEYLAPEILLEREYSYQVDFWSLGVFVYEMLAGYTPFWAEDQMSMYKRVLNDPVEYPFEGHACDLIAQMLIRDPTARSNSTRCLEAHRFFAQIDFNKLLEKKIPPPFVPQVNGKGDVRWFDKEFTDLPVEISPAQTRTPPTQFTGYSYISTSAQKMMNENCVEKQLFDIMEEEVSMSPTGECFLMDL